MNEPWGTISDAQLKQYTKSRKGLQATLAQALLDTRRFYRGEDSSDAVRVSRPWLPTPRNINDLPPPIADFIHRLQQQVDSAGIITENVLVREENRALRTLVEILLSNAGDSDLLLDELM